VTTSIQYAAELVRNITAYMDRETWQCIVNMNHDSWCNHGELNHTQEFYTVILNQQDLWWFVLVMKWTLKITL